MNISNPPRAQLLVKLPTERFIVEIPGGRKPRIGDIVELDQSYTGRDGKQMGTVYCPTESGDDLYQAEVYETEIKIFDN